VHFADDRVSADSAKLRSDLAGAQSFGPKFLEFLDPLVCPVHALSPPFALVMAESLTVVPGAPKQETLDQFW
jgi:hypothetical protein